MFGTTRTGKDIEKVCSGMLVKQLGFNRHETKLPSQRLVLWHGSVAVTAGTRFGT